MAVATAPETLASVDELRDHLGVPQLDAERARALLEDASALIRSETGQQLTEVLGDVAKPASDGGRVLLLPELPVTDIESVKVRGQELAPGSYEWSPSGIVRLTCCGCRWPDCLSCIEVTYDHGFEHIPDELRWVCLELAGRMYARSGDGGGGATGSGAAIRREQIGSYSVTYEAQPTGWTSDERATLRRFTPR